MTEKELKELIEIIRTESDTASQGILRAFIREQKIAGSKSFAKLVRDMRFNQKHNPTTAGKLEEQVDRAVDAVLGVK